MRGRKGAESKTRTPQDAAYWDRLWRDQVRGIAKVKTPSEAKKVERIRYAKTVKWNTP